MKNYFVTIIIASALTISVVIIRQEAQAQNTTPQPMDKMGATIADAVGAKINNQESSPIFVTNIPPGYRDWRFDLRGPRRRQPQRFARHSGQ
jgi:hypothetical protein